MPGIVIPGGAGSSPRAPVEHIRRLKLIVRSVRHLDEDAPILVQQLACGEPGCPPVETVIADLGPPRRAWKFAKPAAEIGHEELVTALNDHPGGIDHDDHD